MTPSILIALAGLFVTVAGGLLALLWRAGVIFGEQKAEIAKMKSELDRHHSYIKELRGKLDSTHDVAVTTRATLESYHGDKE